ncbi:MAG: UDP-N-acetylglucosamine 2-epimerase (non-hydrolyzing) [Candidatus Berkelbacteria bacterium]|nr:UDP-N-acetylglucosamine 2-epimerase (non-hydrolyzing) [Candidatus Berkelbacteria bacterium]
MTKISFVFGTRPEAIKMAPVIIGAKKERGLTPLVLLTGQHREILDSVLDLFKIRPKINLGVMRKNQTLSELTARIIKKLNPVLEIEKPNIVLVQGDTTTALVGALLAFYHQIPVGHIEAGLRSFDKFQPFPEEINRCMISQIADLHFAPTKDAAKNLLTGGIKKDQIFIVGNTVIDAINLIAKKVNIFSKKELNKLNLGKIMVLITTHRRENIGPPMENICRAILKLIKFNPELIFVLPMHPNPKVRETLKKYLDNNPNVHLIEPLDYPDFVLMMKKSYFILTDSGGVQEEAPSLGKPVLVLRETTERKEGIKAGTAIMVGTNQNKIFDTATKLIKNPRTYKKISLVKNPYGDGKSSQRIIEIIKYYFSNKK